MDVIWLGLQLGGRGVTAPMRSMTVICVYHSPAASGNETLEIRYGIMAHFAGGRCGELEGACGKGEARIERRVSPQPACWTVCADTKFVSSGCQCLLPGEVDGRRRLAGRFIDEVAYTERNATAFGNCVVFSK